MIERLNFFIRGKGVPLIVHQSASVERRDAGHYRVVIATGSGSVMVNDPLQQVGGTLIDQSTFLDLWRPHGNITVSGPAIWIGRNAIPELSVIWNSTKRNSRT